MVHLKEWKCTLAANTVVWLDGLQYCRMLLIVIATRMLAGKAITAVLEATLTTSLLAPHAVEQQGQHSCKS